MANTLGGHITSRLGTEAKKHYN